MIHHLKILQVYFDEILNGNKTFEIRKNDRNFKNGDILYLNEYIPGLKQYTGRFIKCKVTYITSYEQKDDYVVMAIKVI